MTLWMLWSTLLAATIGIAALALERAATGFGAPRRHIWTAALVVSVLVPLLLAVRRTEITRVAVAPPTVVQSDAAVADEITSAEQIPTPALGNRAQAPAQPVVGSAISLDVLVLALWIAASSLLAFAFVRSMLQLRRRRQAWTNATVGRHHVLLSAEDGPAVVGFAHPSIVFPRWALALDAQSQEMMLRHETEHIAKGDPRVLFAAGLLLVALPWNAGLWWLVRRLRMAMELDCDARVIQSVGTSREYGLMLLEVCERRPSLLPLASALASTRPLLERRIDAMSLPRPRRPMRAALPFLFIALVATTAAASAPRPASMRAPVIKLQQPTPAKVISTTTAAKPVQGAPQRATPAVAGKPSIVQAPTTAAAVATPSVANSPTRATPSLNQAIAAQPSVAPSTAAAMPSTVAPSTATPSTAKPVPSFAPASPAADAAVASPVRQQKPDRAKIAALATQHVRAVVRGDTAADYVVMVFDASDRYVWSTHGLGGLALQIAGDSRTAAERRQYSMDHRAELMGTAIMGAGGGGGGGIAPTAVRETVAARTAFGRVDTIMLVGSGGRAAGGGVERGSVRVSDSGVASSRVYYNRDSTSAPRIFLRSPVTDSTRSVPVMAAAGVGRSGGGRGGAIGASGGAMAGGGGRGGGGFGGATSRVDSAAASGIYSTRFISSRSSALNAAWGLQESGNGESGIQGLPSAAVASSETYIFAAQELAPQTLRIVVLHLTPNTVWTHRF